VILAVAMAFGEDPIEEGEPTRDPPADSAPTRPAPAHVVVIEAERDDPVVSQQVLDRERVLLTPGTFEDAVRLVQSLPGVAITPEYSPSAGDLAVRGAAPWETRYLLDGIELPYLYHFNGYSSVFPARLLEELRLYPSTFGASVGNACGALVDTRSTWSRPERAMLSANANFVMAGVESAIPVGERWTFRASFRRSYLDGADDEQYPVFPAFADGFARAEYTPSSSARWALTLFGADDQYTRYAGDATVLDPYEQAVNPTFAFHKGFLASALSHRHLVGTTRLDGALAWTGYSLSAVLPAAHDEERLHRVQLREGALMRVSDALTFDLGVDGKLELLDVDLATERPWPEVERESTLLAAGASADERLVRAIGGAWAEAQLSSGTFRVVPGVRVDGDSLSAAMVIDPRISARWQASPHTRLRAGAGSYSQFPEAIWLSPMVGDPDLPPSTSHQVVLGLDTAIARRLEFSVDGYYKHLQDLVAIEPGEAPRGGVEGMAFGVELQSRYRLRELFFASAAVALGHAERDGATFAWDQPFSVNLVASWTFRPTWNAGLRYRAAAGLPYTPIVDGLYDATSDSYLPVYGAAYSTRLPTYQKLDVHLQKDWTFRTWSLALYGEGWFVPPGSNVMYLAWSYDYDEVGEVEGPVFIPLLGLRGEWGVGRTEGTSGAP
jgi:hypothetical protein